MKKKCVLPGLLLTIIGELFMLSIVGCDNGTTNPTITQYTVTFNANGGKVSTSTETVEEGKTLSSLPPHTDKGKRRNYLSRVVHKKWKG
jgi:hypothetical protein